MLELLQQHATRADRSLSYLVQYALEVAGPTIAASEREQLPEKELAGGDKRKQTLYFSGTMLDNLEREALRLDSSLSFVAQAAVTLARKDIETLQAPTFPPED